MAIRAKARALGSTRQLLERDPYDGALTATIAHNLALANDPRVARAARRIERHRAARRERRRKRRRREVLEAIERNGGALSGILAHNLYGWEPRPGRDLPDDYVALGDSYSSGVGSREYFGHTVRAVSPWYGDASYFVPNKCQRGPLAYPALVREELGHPQFRFVACGGAVTEDVLEEQMQAVNGDTKYVTISIGGNDAGFGDVVQACAAPWQWELDCIRAVNEARRVIRDELPDRLDEVYDEIRGRAPRAEVVVVGYPRIYPSALELSGEHCNLGTDVSALDVWLLNRTGDQLARVIGQEAEGHGFEFVDPRSAFEGHGVCGDPEWLNGLSSPTGESYHPSREGYRRYADLVMEVLDRPDT